MFLYLQLDTKHDKSSKVRYLAGFDGIHDILQAASVFQESKSKIHNYPTEDEIIQGYHVSIHTHIRTYISSIVVIEEMQIDDVVCCS